MPAHTNEPHPSSYSLNDLILAISFLEFILSMAAAVLVRYHNGTVNDIIYVFGIALDARCSIVEWIEDRKQKKRLHEMLEERDALRVTNGGGTASLAQISSAEPVGVVAARNNQDVQSNVDESGIATNSLATTMNMNTPAASHIHSTYSPTSLSASGESPVPSRTEKSETRSQNQSSIRKIKGDGVGLELQQVAPALIQEDTKMDTIPLTMVPMPNASLLVEAKGVNEESVAMRPTINVEMDKGNWSSSTLLMPPRTRLETAAASDNDSQYAEQTDLGTVTDESLLMTGAICPIFPASSTLPGARSSLLPSPSDNSEANPISHPITGEGEEIWMQELMEGPQGELDSIAVGKNGRCEEQTVVIHTPLTKTDTNACSAPITKDIDNVLAANAFSRILVTGSTLRRAVDTTLSVRVENSGVNWGMDPTVGDGAGMQENREATSGGELDNVTIGNEGGYEEQTAGIHDDSSTTRNANVGSPSNASSTVPLVPGEATEGERQEQVEVTPLRYHPGEGTEGEK